MITPSTSPLRVAIIGCGGISHAHAGAVRATGGRAALVACADLMPESAKRYAEAYGVPGVYSDYRLMIEKERLDLAIVATWPVLHEEQVLGAIALGVPTILCEKSLTTSAARAARMAAAARAAGARLVEGVMCRHHPRLLEAQRLVQEGKIGALRHIRAGFTRIVGGPNEAPYKMKAAVGGGVPFDFTCYCVNAFGAFMPDLPRRVQATWKRDDDGLVRELMGLLEYPDGTVAQLESSFLMSYQQPLELHGSEGMLRLEDAWTPGSPEIEFRGHERPTQARVIFSATANGHDEQLGHLCDCIQQKTEPRFTLEESVRNHAVLDALLEAAESGKSVTPKIP